MTHAEEYILHHRTLLISKIAYVISSLSYYSFQVYHL